MKIRWVQFIGIVSCFLCVIWLIGFGLAFTNYFYKGTTTVSQLDVVSDEEIFEEAEQGEFEINEHGNAEKGEINLENSETSFLVVALGDSDSRNGRC